MKYINDRGLFLKNLKEINIKDIKVNESVDMSGSGPFSNDTPWGDTLVGRLVNAIRRKIGIGVNMVRIQPLIRRLRTEFDNIAEFSLAGESSEEDKKKMALVIICTIVRDVKLAIVEGASSGSDDSDEADLTNFEVSDEKMTKIKDEDYLKEVDSVITEVIQLVLQITDELGEIEKQDELINILEELQKKVKEMKRNLEEESESTEEESGENSKESENKKSINENFKTVAEIIVEYKSIRDKKAEEFKRKEVKPGSEVGKEVKPGSEVGKEVKPGSEVGKEEVNKNVSQVMDSFIFEAGPISSPVLMPLKKLFDTCIQIEPQIVGDFQAWLKMSEESQLNSKFSDALSRVYKVVKSKSGVSENYIIKEDINVLLSNDNKLGEVIAGLYAVSKQKPDGKFEGISENMQNILSRFNSTMKVILSKEIGEEKKEEENKNITNVMDSFNSKKLLRYSNFRKINEADDNKEIDDSKITYKTQRPILTTYWEGIWDTKLSKILLTEQKYKQLRKEVDKINTESKESLTINGIDPVMSVVKLFNRAYKLYTVNSIPGGRSGGKISRGVSNEYTAVGGGSFGSGENLSGTNGPYRNNRIFNMWENAVLDILSERKYQKIFLKGTKLRVGNKLVDDAGPTFKKLINELLDGSKLYGQGQTGKGAQYEFIDKYFGGDASSDLKPDDFTINKGEKKEIEDTASQVKSTTLNFEKDFDPEIKNINDLKRTIVRIECEMEKGEDEKDEEKLTNKRYFFVIEAKDDIAYIVHSRSFGYLVKYVENDLGKKGMEVTFKEGSYRTEPKTDVYLTKMKVRSFTNMLKNGNSVNLTGHTPDDTTSKDFGKQKTLSKKWLCILQENKPQKYVLETYSFKDSKGFQLDKLQSFAKESTIA
jgi:hypothetical protein